MILSKFHITEAQHLTEFLTTFLNNNYTINATLEQTNPIGYLVTVIMPEGDVEVIPDGDVEEITDEVQSSDDDGLSMSLTGGGTIEEII